MKYPSDQEMYDKIKRVIFSCEYEVHFVVALNMIHRFADVVSKDNDALPYILTKQLYKQYENISGDDKWVR